MSIDFSNILSAPLDNVKKPPVKPAGTYHGVLKAYKFDKSSQKKTPFVRYTIGEVTAGADIEHSALEGVDLPKWSPTVDFYLTEDAAYRLKDFLLSLGIPQTTFNEMIPQAVNMPVTFVAEIQFRTDNQEPFNRVNQVVANV